MSTNGDPTAGSIQFVQSHAPGMTMGEYVITLTQDVTIKGARPQQVPFSTQKRFVISGQRFLLAPTDIQAVFPPAGSQGEHSRALPHVLLDRSTLPWERQADASRLGVPWLALVLFQDQEKPTPIVVKLSDLQNPAGFAAKFPALQPESAQKDSDSVTVIDVRKRVLQAILPTSDELALLAHVRVGVDTAGNPQEQAVIIGNRLPVRDGTSTVHLVSVEGRYANGSFQYQDAGDEDLIRLVSLKSWSFSCVDEKQNFKGLLTHLDRSSSSLRLPRNAHPEVEKYLSMGAVLLPHTFRRAGKTFSWYHGPLVPAENMTTLSLPVPAADALVRYNPVLGLFDISYAAAWELGRLLALQSKQFSTNLYLWKRTHAQQLRQAEQQLLYASLPVQGQSVDASEQFTAISTWFARVGLLQGVPFNYLVPDEHMLPKESIRFFWVDSVWVDCLLDGAFGIGRVTTSDQNQDQNHVAANTSPAVNPYDQITGLLLRSEVVAGWPGLLVSGYGSDGKTLPLLRKECLSPNVLICLFDGVMTSVSFSQHPETLHFGLDEDDQTPPGLCKMLRDNHGYEQQTLLISTIAWQQQAQRVLDIATLARTIQQTTGAASFTSAQFALQMIEGAEEVIFQSAATGAPG